VAKGVKSLTKRERAIERNKMAAHYAVLSGKPIRHVVPVPDAPKPRIKRVTGSSSEPTEADIQRDILIFLRKHPAVSKVWRQNSGTFKLTYGEKERFVRSNTAKGMSDILGVLNNGRIVAIEVKSRKGVIQTHQRSFLDSIKKAGGLAFVARSVDDVKLAFELEGI